MRKFLVAVVSLSTILFGMWFVDALAAPYPAAVGGTGTSQIPASGTIPIGTGSGTYTPAFLLCSGNCSVADASGSVTISVPAQSSSTIQILPVSVATSTYSIIGDGTYITVTNPATSTIEVALSTAQVLRLLSASSPLGYNSSTGQFTCASCITSLNGALLVVNNLSDVASTTVARSNLGLGSIATYSKTDYLTSSTVYVSSVNGQSGAVTITSSSLGVIPFAMTTINGAASLTFHIVGDGTTVTSTVSGVTTTFSIINTGNWAGTWQGTNSTTYQTALTFPLATSLGGTNTTTALGSCAFLNTCGSGGGGFTTTTINGTSALVFHLVGDGSTITTTVSGATTTFSVPSNTFYPYSGNPSSFLTGNQNITLTGQVTGSGATTIATTIPSPLVISAINATTITATSSITVGTSTTGRPLEVYGDFSQGVAKFTRANTQTSTKNGTLIINFQSTGNLADGGGAAYIYQLGDASSTNPQAGAIDVLSDGGGATSTRMEFWTSNASGAAVKFLVGDHNGNVTFPGTASTNGISNTGNVTSTSMTLSTPLGSSSGGTATTTALGSNAFNSTPILGAGYGLGVSGTNAVVSSTFASSSVTFNLYNATTTAPFNLTKIYTSNSKNLAFVSCSEYAAATTTIELYYNTTNASSSIQQVLLSSIACGITGASTSSFTTSTIPAGAYVFADVLSTSGTPTWTTISLAATAQ